ncbi:hypothetical protein HanXRQr2_Chr06g0245671 [Helianthus annuus]|uniref:Uncharacterized protein n=1 Tax=Helianthus annuus TaxID=4232 RepID=A0A9K3NIX2_HELAN|nr:hypothetical protein HanXRQr2_Chr06g0245671 [Helianthus annuus]
MVAAWKLTEFGSIIVHAKANATFLLRKNSKMHPPRIKRVQQVHQYHILPLFHHNLFRSPHFVSRNCQFS